MTFKDDNGNFLEVDGPFAMTKQCVSFFDFSIQGDVSLNFDVPNNSINRKTLNYFGPNMTSQVAWTKQPFSRIKDGNVLDRGYIVIQDEDGPILNCFYVSGNSNWINQITGLITELDYNGVLNSVDYTKRIERASIVNSIGSTSGICFPLIDWGFNYKYNSQNYWAEDNGGWINGFYNFHGQVVDIDADQTKPIIAFYPCMYVHSIMEEIFLQKGLKLSGTLTNDSLYKSLVMTPSNGLMKRQSYANVITTGSSQSMASGTTKYTSLTETSDIDNLFSSNRYTANKNGSLKVTITFVARTNSDIDSVSPIKNGGTGPTVTWTDNTTAVVYIGVTKNDYVEIFIHNSNVAARNATLNVQFDVCTIINTGDYVTPDNFLPDMNCIDLVKSIFNYFGCSVYYDEYSKTVKANIIENINTSNSNDWSSYYVSHRSEYTVDQGQKNYLRLTENNSKETAIKTYNDANSIKFGEGVIQTGNTLTPEVELTKFAFTATKSDFGLNGYYMPYIPLFTLQQSGEVITFSNIDSSTAAGELIFVVPAAANRLNCQEIFGATNSSGKFYGYFIAENFYFVGNSPSAYGKIIDLPISASTGVTGFLTRQKVSYNDVGIRILSVNPNMTIASIANRKDYSTAIEFAGGSSTANNFDYGTFTKEKIGLGLDNTTNNLAIDNPIISSSTFNDPTIKQLYFNRISKIFNNPSIRLQMILPEAVYQSFDFSNFIYLKTEKLTGYFFVASIVNYQDAHTPVEVNVYMI